MKTTLKRVTHWFYHNRQIIVHTMVLISVISYFIYALGYTTNWAGVITESRGASFYRASQRANRLMVDLGFVTLIVVLINMLYGSFKRKKYYLTNFLLSMVTCVLMMVTSILTIYYNSVLYQMYANITIDEVPPHHYINHGAGQKSFAVFEIGTILSYMIIVIALFLLLFTVQKIRIQKERKKLIKELLVNEH